jgi:hypothetical protein
VPADPAIAQNDYVESVVAAIAEGAVLPQADLVQELERRQRVQAIHLDALAAATDRFTSRLQAALADGEAIVAEHIRPALSARDAAARDLLEAHGSALAGEAEVVLSAPVAVGRAWGEFGRIAKEIGALRAIQVDVSVTEKDDGAFVLTSTDPRDPRLWGSGYGARHRTAQRPWPTDPRGHLGWLITSGLPIWVPTGSERDARWEQVFGKPASNLARVGGPGDDVTLP